MANYAVGDIQGCLTELDDLLERIRFKSDRDTLWCVGDLVNRGPDSVGVLRLVKSLGDSAKVVLGNHDLHLIATALAIRAPKPTDTFESVLNAPDKHQLIDWLRSRPLLHYDAQLGICMVHAGIPPDWDLPAARTYAAELQHALQRDACYAELYGDQPGQWSEALQNGQRWRYICNALTRMRYVDHNQALALKAEHLPGTQPASLLPWFACPNRRIRDTAIVFGHWSTLSLTDIPTIEHNVWPLDTGCVWGRSLTAMRLEDFQRYAVPSRQPEVFRGAPQA